MTIFQQVREPFFEPGDRLPTVTTTAVTAGRFAKISGRQAGGSPGLASNGNGGMYQSAHCPQGEKPDGYFIHDGDSGQRVTVLAAPGTVVPIEIQTSITSGTEVEVGTNGRAVPLASGKPAGKALVGGSVGAFAEIRLY